MTGRRDGLRSGAGFVPRLAGGLVAVLVGCAGEATPAPAVLDPPQFIASTGDTVAMQEELRIGRLDGPDEYTFAGIVWAVPTPEGGVILYDLETDDPYGTNGRVRQYDAAGRFVRRIGRRGEGPGEHGPFPMATLLRNGDLLLADQGLARFTRYDSAGGLVATWPGPTGIVEVQATPDGGWYGGIVTDHPRGRPRRIEYVRYDSLGAEVSRSPAPDAYHDGPMGGFGATDAPTSSVAILPDGRMVTTRNDSLVVVIEGPDGVVRVGAAHDPVTYLPEEADARGAAIRGAVARAGAGTPDVDIPRTKMVSGGMWTDRDGRILVRLRTAGFLGDTTMVRQANQSPWRESLALELFDSTATHRGRLVAPRHVLNRGAWFSDSAVWLVEEGESGELSLVKWVPMTEAW